MLPVEGPQEAPEELLEIWPEHWDAVRLFASCTGHWVVLVGFKAAHYQSLDMCQVDVVREWLGITKSEPLLMQLQVMAAEAKEILNR